MLFAERCASCHGENRLGGTGPALIPESLGRLKPAAISKVIAEGKTLTRDLGGKASTTEMADAIAAAL